MATAQHWKRYQFLRIGAALVVILVLAYLALGAYLAFKLTEPVRQPPHIALTSIVGGSEEIRIRSRDGLALAGTFLAAPGSDHALLLAHGFNSCRSCEFDGRFIEFANRMRALGYNVSTIDLRGHGESEGSHVTFGQEEKRDVLGAVDWLQQRGVSKIGVLGVSLGAAGTAEAAVDPNGGEKIRALVLDSCFGEFHGLLEKNFTDRSGYPNSVLPGGLLMTRLLLNVDLEANQPVRDLRKIKVPVMLIYGRHDELVPAEQIPAMAAALPNTEVWISEDSKHARIYNAHTEEYIARVNRFLDQALR